MDKLKRYALSAQQWALHHKKPLMIMSGAVVFVVIFASFLLALRVDNAVERIDTSSSAKEREASETQASPLSGVSVSKELAERPVTAVVYNNFVTARPQSGLLEAGVVHEAIAEGSITRLVAFFQEGKPELIGPIRSQRPYFNEWALQYDAAIAHVGGSVAALEAIDSLGVKDLDQFVHGNSFWRATDRVAPHNVYTSTENLDALMQSKGYEESKFTPMPRKEPAPLETPTASTISINISNYDYSPVYTYNAKDNNYQRALGGAPHKDRETGKTLSPDVVIAMRTNMSFTPNDGRYTIPTTGSGEVLVFQDGGSITGKWQRTSVNDQVRLTDSNGEALQLNPGQTWVTYIDTTDTVTVE